MCFGPTDVVRSRIALLIVAGAANGCNNYTARVPPSQLPALIPALQRVERGEVVQIEIDGAPATIGPADKPELLMVPATRPVDAPGGSCPVREVFVGHEIGCKCEPIYLRSPAGAHVFGSDIQITLSPYHMLVVPVDGIANAELTLDRRSPPTSSPRDRSSNPSSTNEVDIQSIPEPDPNTTLSFSPYHLVWPFMKLTAEFKAHRVLSYAIISGAGAYRGATAAQFGGQIRVFGSRSFARGFHFGLQSYAILMALSDQASGQGPNDFKMDDMRQAIAYSPFAGDLEWARLRGQSFFQVGLVLGYKYTWGSGITVTGQFAPGYGAYFGHRSRFASEPRASPIFAPMFNADVGYSL